MANDPLIAQLTTMVTDLLAEEPTLFLVELKVNVTNDIKVFLDGDQGISIDKCVRINRAMYKQIEELGIFPNNNFGMEVSSPGVDEPLKLHRQYVKNIGKKVEVTFLDNKKQEGTLIAVNEVGITIQYTEGKGKKAVIKTDEIAFVQINTVVVLIVF
jgi:ribosome maturation factor RimP